MINRLHIENFKTIRSLDLACKRLNVFIGDTSTGKTNILEALTLLSQAILKTPQGGPSHFVDKRIIRYERLNELFFNADVGTPVVVEADKAKVSVELDPFLDLFFFNYRDMNGNETVYKFQPPGNQVDLPSTQGNLDTVIHRYQYDADAKFGPHWFPHLSPPDGNNFSALLMRTPALLEEVSDILAAKDIHLSIDRDTFKVTQRLDIARNVAVHLSWATVSETIRRYVFLYTAVRSNTNSVLLLDEPEQNTFPFYTKHIAEIMAREPSNQYFITTHNQYLLQSIVEKAPADEVQVIATYRKEGATHVRVIPLPEVMDMMQYDLFLNLDRLTEA